MSKDAKAVFEAAAAIGKTLASMPPEDQLRVLNAAAVLLGQSGLEVNRGGGPGAGQTLGGSSSGSQHAGGKRRSLPEFLDTCKPKTNPQYLAAFAAYRQIEEKLDTFSLEELRGYFAKARVPDPKKNFMRDFNLAVKSKWLFADGPNSYLTKTGEQAVTAGFGGKGAPRGQAAAKGKRKTGKKKAAS